MISDLLKYYLPNKRIALVIGNSDYTDINTLKNPQNDSWDFSEMLRNLSFDVTLKNDLDEKSIKQAIDEFCLNSTEYDIRLFYYAGHGIQYNGENYLVPIDSKIEIESNIEYDCVNIGRLLSCLDKYDRGANIVILDACRNNPFSFTRSSDSRGLALMSAPSGTLIAFATAPGRTASDGDVRNSPYTEGLLRYFDEEDTDLLKIFQKARYYVSGITSKKQVPWESTSLLSDVFLNNTRIQQAYYDVSTDKEISKIVEASRSIDKELSFCEKVEKDILDRSTEGGALEVFHKDGSIKKVMYSLYGETGKSQDILYVFDDDELLYIKDVHRYNRPFYWDVDSVRETGDSEWFDDNKTIRHLSWYFIKHGKALMIIDGNKKLSMEKMRLVDSQFMKLAEDLLTMAKELYNEATP